jgi:hypothetical protein
MTKDHLEFAIYLKVQQGMMEQQRSSGKARTNLGLFELG